MTGAAAKLVTSEYANWQMRVHVPTIIGVLTRQDNRIELYFQYFVTEIHLLQNNYD